MYGILTENNELSLVFNLLRRKTPEIKEVFLETNNAVGWLMENPENKLIVITPLHQDERSEMKGKLRKYDQQCIGLDPAMLTGSTQDTIFSNTLPMQVTIASQIRDIIGSSSIAH